MAYWFLVLLWIQPAILQTVVTCYSDYQSCAVKCSSGECRELMSTGYCCTHSNCILSKIPIISFEVIEECETKPPPSSTASPSTSSNEQTDDGDKQSSSTDGGNEVTIATPPSCLNKCNKMEVDPPCKIVVDETSNEVIGAVISCVFNIVLYLLYKIFLVLKSKYTIAPIVTQASQPPSLTVAPSNSDLLSHV